MLTPRPAFFDAGNWPFYLAQTVTLSAYAIALCLPSSCRATRSAPSGMGLPANLHAAMCCAAHRALAIDSPPGLSAPRPICDDNSPMADPRSLLSVGIDVGTTTTQVVFSRLTLQDTARP